MIALIVHAGDIIAFYLRDWIQSESASVKQYSRQSRGNENRAAGLHHQATRAQFMSLGYDLHLSCKTIHAIEDRLVRRVGLSEGRLSLSIETGWWQQHAIMCTITHGTW
jgi:hypothetical protein